MTYSAIVLDPAWHEPGGHNRGSDDRYTTLDRAGLARAILTAPCFRPANDCHGYMWTTMTSLVDGLWLLDAIGFRYVTHGVWVKTDPTEPVERYDITLGQYFRGAHEVFLFGVRGRGFACRSEARNIPSVIAAPTPRESGPRGEGTGRRIHSRKPDKFFDMVERRTTGARLEMFARARRSGWDGWGNEYPQEALKETA